MFQNVDPEVIHTIGTELKELGPLVLLIVVVGVGIYLLWRYSNKSLDIQEQREKSESKIALANSEQLNRLITANATSLQQLNRQSVELVKQSGDIDVLTTNITRLGDYVATLATTVGQVGELLTVHDTKAEARVDEINNHTSAVAVAAQNTLLEAMEQMEQRIEEVCRDKADANVLNGIEQKLTQMSIIIEQSKCRMEPDAIEQ